MKLSGHFIFRWLIVIRPGGCGGGGSLVFRFFFFFAAGLYHPPASDDPLIAATDPLQRCVDLFMCNDPSAARFARFAQRARHAYNDIYYYIVRQRVHTHTHKHTCAIRI